MPAHATTRAAHHFLARCTAAALGAALALAAAPSARAQECPAAAPDASRIAVAGGSLTEILYLLGEERRIAAVDSTSTYPPQARDFASIGYVRNLSAEGLLSQAPTLVLGESDMGPPAVLEQLAAAGVAVARVPEQHSAQGILAKVRCVGQILGVAAAAEALIERELEPRRRELAERAASARPLRVGVLLGVREGTPLGAGADSSGDGLLRMLGAHNAFAATSGWKPISVEAMLDAAPDALLVAERGGAHAGGLQRLRADPAFGLTPAARSGRVLSVDAMALLGFGPRSLQTALELLDRLQAQAQAQP